MPARTDQSDTDVAAPAAPPARSGPSVAFVSLGCPKNLVDSETMLGTLETSGFRLVDSDQPADAIVINTCGFLESSKEESLSVIHEAIERKRAGEVGRVVVAGCLVQRHRAKLLDWAPGIDAMIGVFDRDHVLDAVNGDVSAIREAAARVDVNVAERVGDGTAARRAAPPGHSPEPRYWITGNALQAARERGVNTVGLTVNGADGKGVGYFESDAARYRLTPRHWAYLRISEGCNQRCAFCTIPSIRGKMRSKPLDRITDEARRLMADGAFELNLIGQDTTSYGYDIYGRNGARLPAAAPGRASRGARAQPTHPLAPSLKGGGTNGGDLKGGGTSDGGLKGGGTSDGGLKGGGNCIGDLIGLLTALNNVAAEFGGGWIRLMYVYPTHFIDDMIDAIAALPNIVKYIDIPLQHMSDRMLHAMRRNITRAEQESLLHKLRDRIPGLAIRTTFITGFPGETETDHQELLEFVDDFGFDMMGVFQYSREEGTPAGTMDLDPALHVPYEIKHERERDLMLTQQRIAFENAAYVAEQRCQFDVLIDGPADRTPHEEFAELGHNRIEHDEGRDHSPGRSTPDDGGVLYLGRCYHQAPQVDSATYVRSRRPLSPGELVRCTIVGSDGYDLVARPTQDLERTIPLVQSPH